jgi:hypothetical protein
MPICFTVLISIAGSIFISGCGVVSERARWTISSLRWQNGARRNDQSNAIT